MINCVLIHLFTPSSFLYHFRNERKKKSSHVTQTQFESSLWLSVKGSKKKRKTTITKHILKRKGGIMSSSLDTSTAPSASSSTMSNTQSSPNNAATDFSTNATGNLIGSSDAASTSSRTTEPTSSTDPKLGDTDKLNANDTNGSKKDDSMFECNICLDTAKEAVVSMCGHLFCWPCLHQWLETRPTRQLCPVCKAAISKEKVIPLYGRGSTKEEDPRYVSIDSFSNKNRKNKQTIAW